jgi:hypothetical protein
MTGTMEKYCRKAVGQGENRKEVSCKKVYVRAGDGELSELRGGGVGG